MTIAPNDFTHLHVHSEFSLLDGLGRITDLVDSAAQQGFDSLAITDHGALYGAVGFYQACVNKGIKPIIGVETYVARRSMTEKEGKADAQPYHLILLAKDDVGYRNLCRLVTDAHVDGYYYKPRIDREHLARYSEGLVGLSACLGGEVARALEVDDWELARSVAGEYGEILGPGNFFLELQDHGMAEQKALNEKLLRLAPETGLPLVVTNDLHYVHEVQADAHDVLLCVGTGNNIDTPEPDEVRDARLLAEVGRPDGRALPRSARGDPQYPPDLRDDGPQAAAGKPPDPELPGARRGDPGELAPQGMRARPRAPLRDGDPGAPGAARLRARRHPLDGLRRLLPHRRGLHPRSPASSGSRPRAGGARPARS